ncbi:hypothetical protein ACN4EK_05735 [Pantanalinema rosaneae CENA516]|uniref:hypothetical protein n=1 Tax=Pantanalinema rosaneae TaxID=1620701 RepID=UPI003D6DABEE
MSLTAEELQALDSQRTKAKRPNPNRDQQQQQLAQVEQTTTNAISSFAQAGIQGINTQVLAFDSKLTRYERDTARAMADRLRQSPLRIQQYLVEELASENTPSPDFLTVIDKALEVPDLTSNFLAISPTSIVGALPL